MPDMGVWQAKRLEAPVTTQHNLKIWPGHYRALVTGHMTHQVRLNDRNYQVGDELLLREWNDCAQQYTESPFLEYVVTHIAHGPGFGLKPGWCCMSIRKL